MTRKKSNVKALALAVTCAILAGGYSGLNPVYAAGAQKLYKGNSGAVTTVADTTSSPSTTEEITKITVGGVTLGDFGTSGGTGRIEASNVKISNNLTVDNNLNIGNAITISGSDGKLTVNAARINGNNTVTGILRVGEIKGLDVIDSSTSTVSGQADLTINGTTFKDGGKVAANALEIGSAELTAEKLAALNTAVANDGKIVGANGSTVGGVGFSSGVVTGVKSINAGDSTAKFKVTEDNNSYTFRAGNLQITTGKEIDSNGELQLNGKITFADTNRPGSYDITLEEIAATRNKTKGILRESTGEYTEIEGKLKVYKDGTVNVDGTLTAKSGSKIGNITIDDGQLVAPLSGGTNGVVRVNVTDLADDHKIITEDTQYTYSSKKVKSKIDSLETSEAALSAKTQAIGRVLDDSNNPVGTAIENKLRVYDNGTVTINEGATNNAVTINSKGIKVGNNSAVVSEDGFKTSGDLYVGTKTSPTEEATESRFYVKGSDGSIKAADGQFEVNGYGDVTATGQIKSGKLAVGENGNEFDVDEKGNVISKGFLKAADGNFEVATDGSVTTKGSIKAADGKFEVDGDGNVNASGQLKSTKLAAGTNGDEFTVDENGNIVAKGTLQTAGDISTDGKIAAKGSLSAADGKFAVDTDGTVSVGTDKFKVDGTTGDTTVGGTLNVTGDTTLDGNLGVTGNATVGGTLNVTGDATFDGNIKGKSLNIGATGNEFIVDTVGNINANAITTSDSAVNKIGGVTLSGSDIKGRNLELTGTLTANKYEAKDIEATDSISVGATKLTDGKLDLGSNGTIDFGANELNDAQVGNINNVIKTGGVVNAANGSEVGGVTFNAGNVTGVKDLTANGNITAKKVTAEEITDGTATLKNGALTGLTSASIGGTTIDSTGINTNKLTVGTGLNATTIDESNGIVSAKGEIGAVKFTGAGKLENVTSIDGVSVAQNSGSANGGLTFGGNAVIGATGTPFQSTGFKVDDDGDVEGKTFTTAADGSGNKSILASGSLTIDANNTWTKDAGIIASNVKVGSNELKNDGLHVGTNTTVKDGELTVGTGNTWSMANGITASKAGINGVTIGETEGKATFNNAGNTTTIDGDKITTGTITADELNVDKISLGKGTDKNITIGSNGDVTTKGEIKITDAAGNVMTKLAKDSATFGNDATNQTVIDKGTIKAKAKSAANQQAELGFNENGLTVSGQNAEGKNSSFSFNAKTGANTFTGQDNTTTTINGSKLTSTNGTATGVLDGSNLTLTNGTTKSTTMEAGKVTFKSETAGEHDGKETTIDGGTITTDTLNVERINLGGELLDSNGTPLGGNLSMDAQGNFSAAGGSFKVTGGSGADKGAMTNTVGNTTLKTDTAGAGMSYAGTVTDADGNTSNVTSNVSVGNNNANVSAGNASIDVVNDSITDKVGGTTVETKDGSFSVKGNTGNGMEMNTNTGETTFTGAAGEKGGNTTTINGGNITTDTLNVERINLGGEMVDKTGATVGGNLSMDAQGNFSAAGGKFKVNGADGAMTNTVGKTSFATSDDGVNSSVTQDAEHKSEFKQGLTSIGGVVTNGTVKIAQTLDGANGNITNEVTDKDGKSSKLVQNGTGLEYTDSTNDKNATRINSSDVSIGSATDDSKRINLSDLGQIDDLDTELSARDEFKNNPTAVGGINAEAAVRREEVARLDNRIDDVNERVDKVGAMAAAIASLKSIGYDPQAPSEFSVGLGQYKGETGVALGFFHYPNKNFMINVSLSTAGGETMGGIGATWRFGHKSPQKLLDEQRAAQAKKELAAAEKYKAAAQLAKEAQERAEYAAKLARQAQVSADNAKAAADATQAKHFN